MCVPERAFAACLAHVLSLLNRAVPSGRQWEQRRVQAPLLALFHTVRPSGLSDFHKFTLTSKAPLSSKIRSSLVCPCLPLSPEESPFIMELQFPECILQVWQSLPAELLTARCKHFPCIGRKQP